MLSKGFCRNVKDSYDENEQWLIPHHGVYHQRKKKIRVVFDCSSKFRGKSLNSELLQGPDLTNQLVGDSVNTTLQPWAISKLCSTKSRFQKHNDVTYNSFGGRIVIRKMKFKRMKCVLISSAERHNPAVQTTLWGKQRPTVKNQPTRCGEVSTLTTC